MSLIVATRFKEMSIMVNYNNLANSLVCLAWSRIFGGIKPKSMLYFNGYEIPLEISSI